MSKLNIKHIVILIALSLGVFWVALFNQFTGDDHVLFEGNAFYTSWGHWPDLFTQKYSTTSSMGQESKAVYHSGSVAYRPVLSSTYFWDYSLWKLNPFGYHLDNLLLHTINTILVYLILIQICQDPALALFSACLFCVHPTKVEAVASIGYRADLLACFWQLLSLLAFIYYRLRKRKSYFAGCLAFYFLALFTKESAIIMPLVFMAYDYYFGELVLKDYAMPIGLTGFYLYVYFFVFPNTSLVHLQYLGGSFAHHATVIAWIFSRYIIDLILPFQVMMLPPLYLPPIEPLALLKLFSGILIFAALIVAIIKFYKSNKLISFFLFIFLVGFIPIANIIPLANPMAHRFLYFPSIGFAALLGLIFMRWQNRLRGVFQVALIGLCIAVTVPLTMRWHSDLSVARTLVEYYPENIKGHLILGVQFLKIGQKNQAAVEFQKCLQLGDKDPWIYYLMGVAVDDKPQEAAMYFQKAIEVAPNVSTPYLALEQLYKKTGNDQAAQQILKQARAAGIKDE